jgi:predicted Rossmann fold flavoprotein
MIVIGSGASAGFLASFLRDRRYGGSILFLEKNAQPFKKIMISGNGRCNYSNRIIVPESYHSLNGCASWQRSAFAHVAGLNLERYLFERGVPSHADEYDRLFPWTNSAKTIVAFFQKNIEALSAKVMCNAVVSALHPATESGEYRVDWTSGKHKNKSTACSPVVVYAAGGAAYPQLGSDGTAFELLKNLKHTITPLLPAIVPLETPRSAFRNCAGLKIECEITVGSVFKRTGELLFTDYGISGPNVFYASS